MGALVLSTLVNYIHLFYSSELEMCALLADAGDKESQQKGIRSAIRGNGNRDEGLTQLSKRYSPLVSVDSLE